MKNFFSELNGISELFGVGTMAGTITKLTPPVAVGTSILAGFNLPNLVLVATLVYTCIQIYITLHNFLKKREKDERNEQNK